MVLTMQKNTENNSALQDFFYEALYLAMEVGTGIYK